MNPLTPASAPLPAVPALEHAAVGRPITRAGVSLVPVYLHQGLGAPVLTGAAAPVEITEDAAESVPSVTVTSSAAGPVLLVEGETVAGGLQQRTLDVSVLVPAGATLRVPVSCVEMGRWGGRRRFDRGRSFATSRVRRSKQASLEASLRQRSRKKADQHEVWASVDESLNLLAAPSPTRNLADADLVLDRDDRRAAGLADLLALGPLPGQCGVVVFHGRHLVGAEVLGAPDLLAAHWEPMVRSLLLEAPGQVEGRPSVGRAVRFLARLGTGRAVPADGVGLGRERHVRTSRLVGQVLTWDDAVVHASGFALAA
ncbi:MAG: ARPP-1 family domain-containing protein [Microthrixaceae bacterium]